MAAGSVHLGPDHATKYAGCVRGHRSCVNWHSGSGQQEIQRLLITR